MTKWPYTAEEFAWMRANIEKPLEEMPGYDNEEMTTRFQQWRHIKSLERQIKNINNPQEEEENAVESNRNFEDGYREYCIDCASVGKYPKTYGEWCDKCDRDVDFGYEVLENIETAEKRREIEKERRAGKA